MPAVHLEDLGELRPALDAHGIGSGVPVIVLIGGAAGLAEGETEAAARAIHDAVMPVAADVGATVLDGGTDAGVMQLAGWARRDRDDWIPLVGVIPAGPAQRASDAGQGSILEPNHSLVLLVPGEAWGDETGWLFEVALEIAAGCPIRTILVNGGPVAERELAESLRLGIPAVVIRGTGRAADVVAAEVPTGNGYRGTASRRGYDTSGIVAVHAADVEGLRSMLAEALRGA